ncbi:hypothetical protein [Flagellimonas allohymeniacidonis]|uniref:TonB C-terminal domain-containing protein n=1 Tax=Flagellimonas allohymeniacidonis TaxID=2517819 RepID=A0A4Q8QGD5_9FLAO|nr:hypothetical protein [Allomuricauda hymeniacidonis]TAI47176.1 hypothetical protein EW142_10845 [Allomuricauda hymeniacidonis]
MRKLFGILILGLSTSCNLFVSQEETTKNMVNQELLEINWNDVDQYPLFEGCEEDLDKIAQRSCFESAMLGYFSESLEGLSFQVNKDMNDTIYVDFLIDEHGFIAVQNVEEKESVLNEIANFNTEVSRRLNDLTTVAPALKRGVPVSIRFRLPIILNTN